MLRLRRRATCFAGCMEEELEFCAYGARQRACIALLGMLDYGIIFAVRMRKIMKLAWTVSFAVLMLLLADSTHSMLVDRILAVVNRQPVTLSDLNRYQAFIALNDGKKNWEAPPSPSPAVLQQLIDRKLLLEEAEKFEIGLPKTTDLLEAQDRLAKRFSNTEEFQNTLLHWG